MPVRVGEKGVGIRLDSTLERQPVLRMIALQGNTPTYPGARVERRRYA